MVALLGAEWMSFKATGRQPPRRANRDPNLCPHGVFPAAPSDQSPDEWIALAVDGDEEWTTLCELIDHPELALDPRFATHVARKRNEDALDEIIAVWTSGRDKWDAADALQAAGVAAAAVEHLADTHGRDPQLRDHYQVVSQPGRPDLDIPIDREAARWVGSDHRLRRAPGLGEHNRQVVCDLLGRAEDEYERLVVAGVLE